MNPKTTANEVVYQVIGWDKCFEGAKSKTYSNKSSCQMPTKHGLGYKRLIRRKNGREGNDNCPYMTAQYVQCWRDGHAQGKAETESED